MRSGDDTGRTGAVLVDRFRVGERIAGLDWATVYRGHDDERARPVALLVIEPVAAGRWVEATLAELEATARMDHPGLIAARSAGVLPDGGVYAVLDALDGRSLRAVIGDAAAGQAPPWSITRSVVAQLLDAVAAGDAGHDAIGPDLAFVDERDGAATARLLPVGFGALREALRDAHPQLWSPNPLAMLDGDYLSPELLRGEPTDPRSPQYQLGCVLHALVTGRPPFSGATPLERLAQHLTAPRPTTIAAADGVEAPPGLAAVVARMLAVAPGDRYPTLAEARDAVLGLAAPPSSTVLRPLDGGLSQRFEGDVIRLAGTPEGGDVHVPELGGTAYVDLIRQPRAGWRVQRVAADPTAPAIEPAWLAAGDVLEVAGRRWQVDAVAADDHAPLDLHLAVTYGPPPDWRDHPRSWPLRVGLIALALAAIAAGWWWLAR